MMMKRRDVLKTAGLVLGYTLTAGTAAAVLGGCTADSTPDWTPEYLSSEQVTTLNNLAETIIPGNDKLPGAKDVNIAKFMDEHYGMYLTEAQQQEFMAAYDAFVANHKVNSMSKEERLALVKSELEANSEFMKIVYESSLTGLLTSERGSKEILVFDPIPGAQKGCIPLEEVGGIWAI